MLKYKSKASGESAGWDWRQLVFLKSFKKGKSGDFPFFA
jgi:hypothetical protein